MFMIKPKGHVNEKNFLNVSPYRVNIRKDLDQWIRYTKDKPYEI